MNTYLGCPIIVGVPLSADYMMDTRITTTIEWWDRSDLVETFYSPTDFPTLGRDKIVSYAKYRIPSPTHILFLDSDILPRKNTLERLLEHDKDIISGVYPMVTKNGMSWSISREEPFKAVDIQELPKNPFKIKHCGFGIVLVKYDVFEKLNWPYWKNVFRPGGIEKGEDIYFCEKAREAGFDIWCDPKVKCNHIRITNLMSIINNIKE